MTMQSCSTPIDILILGGTLLTMSKDMAVIEDPAIGIRDGKILFIEETHNILTSICRPAQVIEASGCIIIPGLINTHTHAAMVCFRGIADDLPLMTWLNDYIFPLERHWVNREMVAAGSLLAMAEMIRSGTTTCCDAYFYESSVIEAARKVGMRIVAAMGIFDGNPRVNDVIQTKKHVEAAERYLQRWLGVSDLIIPALFCHAPYTCSPATMQAIKKVAREGDVPFLTHLSETREEIELVRKYFGLTPVRHLEALGVLDHHTVAVHCNWVDDEEIAILAQRQVKVSHNPESNMKLASGMAPIIEMSSQGIKVGLGTDGCASNNDHDMFGEMSAAAKIHKLLAMDPTVMDAKTVLRMATTIGAEVLGLEHVTGSIEVGKAADLIIVDARKPRLTPLYNPYSQIVYAACGEDVITTIIGGQVVMRDRRLMTFDEGEAMEAVELIARDIRKSFIPRNGRM